MPEIAKRKFIQSSANHPNQYNNLYISKVLFMRLPHSKMHEVSELRLQCVSENVQQHDIIILNKDESTEAGKRTLPFLLNMLRGTGERCVKRRCERHYSCDF